jgi:hypothetical protein
MASRKNSKNPAFRNSFFFGLIIFGTIFFFGGGIICHIILRINDSSFLKKIQEVKAPIPIESEKPEEIQPQEPQIRIDTLYEIKYVTESCKKNHCEESLVNLDQPKDSTVK